MEMTNIPMLSMQMSQSRLMENVSTAVLSMSLDHQNAAGSQVVEALSRSVGEQSVHPYLGQNIDLVV